MELSREDVSSAIASLGACFLATSLDCVKLIDIDGCVRFLNDAGLALLEADFFSALLGKPWVEFWPEEARPLVREAINEARRGGVARFTAILPDDEGHSQMVGGRRRADARPSGAVRSSDGDLARRFERESPRGSD